MNASKKARFQRAFGWFDTNGDQFFTVDDLLEPWTGFAQAMNISLDSEEYQSTKHYIEEMFAAIVKVADQDNDGKIELAEFYLWGEALSDPDSEARAAFDGLTKFAIGMQDLNKDGSISRDEYVGVLSQYGKSADVANRAWDIFAEGQESLSIADYTKVANTYYYSDAAEHSSYMMLPPDDF